jgi:hypothetical protein
MDRIRDFTRSSAASWLVFLAGAGTLLAFAPRVLAVLGRPSDPFQGVPIRVKNHWVGALVGQQVHLPDRDAEGRVLEVGRKYLVVTLPCISCSSPEAFLETLSAASITPVIVCLDTVSKPWLEAFGSDPDRFRLVEAGFGTGVVPDSMLTNAPQAAFIGSDGRILKVPAEDETLRAFLAREGFSDGS